MALWFLSTISLLIWIVVLPITQPEQFNRRFVEKAMKRNRIRDALVYMSARERSDFPPHWDPPPRIGYGEATPDLWEVVSLASDVDVTEWVRLLFTDKIIGQSRTPPHASPRVVNLSRIEQQHLEAYLQLLRELPEGREIAAGHSRAIERIFNREKHPERPQPIPAWRRELLEEILVFGGDEMNAVEEAIESPEPALADDPTEP